MQSITEIMKKLITLCSISFNDDIISRELIIKAYYKFFLKTIDKRRHNIGVIINPESIYFDIISVIISVFIILANNEIESDDIIESLEIDDKVTYGKEKRSIYFFKGIENIDSKKFACLESGKKCKIFVPMDRWGLIEPYYGEAKCLDGRGIRNNDNDNNELRKDFFVEILGFERNKVPVITDVSSVIIMKKEKAEELLKGIKIHFNKKAIGILDLIKVSYFTEDNEVSIGCNSNKIEANLKICNKISVARSLILSRNGNKALGLMILDKNLLIRGISEIPELISRKSLKYVYINASIYNDYIYNLVKENEEVEVFICSDNFIKENISLKVKKNNKRTLELNKLEKRLINRRINKEVLIKSPISEKDYSRLKDVITSFNKDVYESYEKDLFIRILYSLINLFSTAVFSMKQIEILKDMGVIGIGTPKEKILMLKECEKTFPEKIQIISNEIIEIIEDMYNILEKYTEKERWINGYIQMKEFRNIAIIVPKVYYNQIFLTTIKNFKHKKYRIGVYTFSNFDDSKVYDKIIIIGNIDQYEKNGFTCYSSYEIITLLYPFELDKYKRRINNYKRRKNFFERRSTIEIKENNVSNLEDYGKKIEENNKETIDNTKDDLEIYDYKDDIDLIENIEINKYNNIIHKKSNLQTQVTNKIYFEDRRQAFLSKNYKAYVINEGLGKIKEVKNEDLRAGDSLIFTLNTIETKDMVDLILQVAIDDKKLSSYYVNCYKKSKEWKDLLLKYIESKDLSINYIAKKIISKGGNIKEQTVQSWLYEDSHIVGPRNKESIRIIGQIINNEDMEKNYNEYFEACREIRHIRRKILKEIGNAILDKSVNRKVPRNKNMISIYDKISPNFEILKIECIEKINKNIPINLANKPIE